MGLLFQDDKVLRNVMQFEVWSVGNIEMWQELRNMKIFLLELMLVKSS